MFEGLADAVEGEWEVELGVEWQSVNEDDERGWWRDVVMCDL